MNLSELIYKRLSDTEALTGKLCTFMDKPAIFSPEAPEDNQEGWGGAQYPKVIFNYDLLADEKRHSTGTLTVTLLCQNTADVKPDSIEAQIIKALCDVVLKPDNGIPYCFAWSRTEGFTIDEKSAAFTIGSDIRFDIIEYPSQITTDPDPVIAVCQYIKEIYPESVLIGYDRLEEITEVTNEKPVIYCRLLSTENTGITYTIAWMDCNMAVHVLCPAGDTRLAYLSGINTKLAVDGEVTLFDGSPMHVKHLKMNNTSDYLKSGQITFTGKYGIVRAQEMQKPLNEMNNNLKVDNKGGARWVVRKKP